MTAISFSELPRVNVQKLLEGGSARAKEVEKIRSCVFSLGIFIIDNTGIDSKKIHLGIEIMQKLFALDEEVKRAYERPADKYQEGYIPWGQEHAKGEVKSDHKEVWHVKGDRKYKRINPEEIEGFEVFFELFSELELMAIELLEAIGEVIGRKPGHYREMVTGGDSLLRLLNYKLHPSLQEKSIEEIMETPWAAKHEDIGLLTILTTAIGKALHVQAHNGEVFVPELAEGEMVAQIGDSLAYESGKLGDSPALISTPHWVANVNGEKQRSAMPFFTHAMPEAMIADMTADDLLNKRLEEIGLAEHAT